MTSKPVTYTVVSQLSGATVPALDAVSVFSAAAYSLRRLSYNYKANAAIRVRRSSDNAELDIGFTAGGDLDTTALLNHTSFDIGRTWDAGVLISGAGAIGITQLSNGDVLTVGLTTNLVYRSTDNGVTWNAGVLVATGANVRDITQLSNGDVLVTGNSTNLVYRSTDNGVTWNAGVLVASGAAIIGITQLSNGDVLVTGNSTSRVYRSTDNGVTWDAGVLVAAGAGLFGITQLSNGDVLVAGLTTNLVYRSTPTGFITTWYDQSGNGRNLVQATAANQPLIVNAGAVVTQNGKPSISFDGVNDVLSSASNFINSLIGGNAFTATSVTGGSNSQFGFTGNLINGGGSIPRLYMQRNAYSYDSASGLIINATFGMRVITYAHDGSSSQSAFLDGVSKGTVTQNVVSSFGGGYLSVPLFSGGVAQAGNASEFLMFASALSTTNRQTLERNQGAYYSISVA